MSSTRQKRDALTEQEQQIAEAAETQGRSCVYYATAVETDLPGNARALMFGRFGEDAIARMTAEAEGQDCQVDWLTLTFEVKGHEDLGLTKGNPFELWAYTAEVDDV